MNRTLVGEVQALCTATVLDQQTLELARSLELRSGAYRASALPVELYQRSWRGDSNADHGLTRPALFLLSYTSTKLRRENLEAVGRIALPMICFAGRCLAVLATPPQTYLLTWSGRRDSNPRSRRWQRRVLATRRLPALARISFEEGHFTQAENGARQAGKEFEKGNDTNDEAQAEVLLIRSLVAQMKVDEADKILQHAQQLANKTGDTATLAHVALGMAAVESASGRRLEAASLLRNTLAGTKDRIPMSIRLEARLMLAELEMDLKHPAAGRTQLFSLEQDAKAKGFLLMARKAATARLHPNSAAKHRSS